MTKATTTFGFKASRRQEGFLQLVPETGAEFVDGGLHATSLPFWLRVEPVRLISDHRWIRLRYSSGFFDQPVRPLIRFVTKNGREFIQPMNGATLGSGEWVGRVPNRTETVSISPGCRLGPFSFRLERAEPLSRPDLLKRGFFTDPLFALWSIRSRLVDSREEAWQSLKYARGGTPFQRYGEWYARFARPLDLGGFDRPRADWSTTPQFHLLMSLRGAKLEAVRSTLSSLRAQVYERWSLHVVIDDDTPSQLAAAFREEMQKDSRLCEVALTAQSARSPTFGDGDWLGTIQAGDLLQDYALAVVAEAVAAEPDLAVLYSDEDAIGPNGNAHAPIFKPDWSPISYSVVPYIGRLTCIRYRSLVAPKASALDFLLDEQMLLRNVLTRLDRKEVGHIRRVLYRRRSEGPKAVSNARGVTRKEAAEDPAWPEVSIIIPTRDRADLLKTCTQGLKEKTDYPSFNVVIVDNGSTQPKARALLANLRNDPRFQVLERPEPFNYSKLSNDGARATNSSMLVFLNNDVHIFDAGWLKAIVRWAMRPHVGVVGAKLLFPNRKVQHAGIVLGMGGITGHIYRGCRRREPGYLNQLGTIREMAAVTGACIAIDRAKFEAVGGFDAENLPIDLNDIDLCLRVAERGWTNVWTPEAVLIHLQSASRGIERNPFEDYRQERMYFIQRWSEAIRDDPYFHPGFSLFARRPALS